MTIFSDLFISLGAAVLLASNLGAERPLDLQYQLTPKEIEPGQHATLELRLPLPKNEDDIKTEDKLLFDSKKIVVLNSERNTEENEIVWRYEITAHDSGSYVIPPIEISLGPQSFSSERIELKVTSSRGQEDFSVRKGFAEAKIPRKIPPWVKTVLIILIMTAILTPLVWKWMQKLLPKLKKKAPVQVTPPEPREPDLDWLKRHLEEYKRRLAEAPQDPQLVDELTHILRKYYSRKYGYPVRALTTNEFRNRFCNESWSTAMTAIFDECDQFKFEKTSANPFEIASKCLEQAEHTLIPCT